MNSGDTDQYSLPRVCTKCGYALTGLSGSGTCPECGESFDENAFYMPSLFTTKKHNRSNRPIHSSSIWMCITAVLMLAGSLHALAAGLPFKLLNLILALVVTALAIMVLSPPFRHLSRPYEAVYVNETGFAIGRKRRLEFHWRSLINLEPQADLKPLVLTFEDEGSKETLRYYCKREGENWTIAIAGFSSTDEKQALVKFIRDHAHLIG